VTDRDVTDRDVSDIVIARSESALWRRLFDGVLVLGPLADRPLHISAPGYTIWELLETPTTIRQIAETLATAFGERADTIRPDVVEVVRRLDEHAAIEPPLSPYHETVLTRT
jgi:hypothetical protein